LSTTHDRIFELKNAESLEGRRMSTGQSAPLPPDPPPTFSLRTLFLVVTCTGIVCAGFRLGGREDGPRLALLFLAAFLTIWFFVTRRFRWARNLLFFGLIAMIFCSLLPEPTSHPASPGAECSNNLRNIGMALLAFHNAHGSFPPAYVADKAGRPLYSWRVLICPQLERKSFYDAFQLDEPWNSPTNAPLSGLQFIDWQCPSDVASESGTSYLAVVGPDTAWPGERGSKLADFKDPSKTILVVEVANSGINWAEPRDLHVGQMAPRINPKSGQGISSFHAAGVHALFADGHVESIPVDINPKELAKMLEINPRN
jgi:prepilin-type processing-associated H-X9-DG protein